MDRRLSGIVFTVIFSIAFCNSCVGNFFADSKAFFTAFLNAPKKVGSVIPSSSFLANAMTRYVQRKDAPIKVLEVGAGTGALTKTIAARMGEGDLFDVIEIDPDLCDVLRDKFKNNKNVKVHCISISDWNPQYNYDFIVSSVPFNSFRSGTVKTILDKYEALIKPLSNQNRNVLPFCQNRNVRFFK